MGTAGNGTLRKRLTLLLGAAGVAGSRIAQRLWDDGHPIRIGSRFGSVRFDWRDRSTWSPALRDVQTVFLGSHSDLATANAGAALRSFIELAEAGGVRRIVMLSRETEAGIAGCERVLRDSRLAWTIVRIRGSDTISMDEVADVVVPALTEDGSAGRICDLDARPAVPAIDGILHLGVVGARRQPATGRG